VIAQTGHALRTVVFVAVERTSMDFAGEFGFLLLECIQISELMKWMEASIVLGNMVELEIGEFRTKRLEYGDQQRDLRLGIWLHSIGPANDCEETR
jgi:hypothetical protein